MSFFSLRDVGGKPGEASTPGCENATVRARKPLGDEAAELLAVFQIDDGAAENFEASLPDRQALRTHLDDAECPCPQRR